MSDKMKWSEKAGVMDRGRKEPVLTVKDLVVRFYSIDGVVHAINGVAFNLYEGEILAIVGESGSGKSVTMMSLVDLIPKPPGKVEGGEAILFDSESSQDLLQMSSEEVRRIRGAQVGFIFQDPISSLNPTMTIGNQIAETMIEHLHVSHATARANTILLLKEVGISDAERRFDSYPHEFSGGMRQRVMIAIAMACQPRIVIADEPTTALDVTVQAQITDLVLRLQRQMGVSVIWITHDLGVVAGLADRVLVMYGGTVVESALVDVLYETPYHPYTIGLLKAIPHVNEKGEMQTDDLESIEGVPPDLLSPLEQCPFAPRCGFAFDRCFTELPPLRLVAERHRVACFFDVINGVPRGDI